MKSNKIKNSRREFVKSSAKMLGVCACFSAASPLFQSCENFVQKEASSSGRAEVIDVTEYEKLMKDYYGVMFSFGMANYGIPVLVVRLREAEYVCFSSLCTHDHCSGDDISLPSGDYDGYRLIRCTCHGSHFDASKNGEVVKGPAERPLKQFATSFDPETNLLTIFF